MMTSKQYYDKISKDYSKQSEERIDYLDAIDLLIQKRCGSRRFENYLDVGSGDGRRAIKLINFVQPSKSKLLDDCENLLDLVKDSNLDIVRSSIFDYHTSENFDLITCLWNVIGHFPSKKSRILFFKKIDNFLTKEGLFFFDVNNRYNISHYGKSNVMNNIINDQSIDSFDSTGYFDLSIDEVDTKVYIHNPFDIKDYLEYTNLKLKETVFVNYATGKVEKTFFEGQLFYVIGK